MGSALLGVVSYLLQGAEEFVARTDNPWDDLLVEILGVVYEDETVRDWLAGILDNTPENTLPLLGEAPQHVSAAFERRGIPWDKVIQNLPAILSLVRVFLGK